MKKELKELEAERASTNRTRRVVTLRELDKNELASVGGGAHQRPPRPWLWGNY